MRAGGERVDRSVKQQIVGLVGLLFDRGELVRDLGDHAGARVGVIVPSDRAAVGVEGGGLRDDVERAPFIKLEVDHGKRLQPRSEPRFRASDALGHPAHLSMPSREEGDDPVGLAQVVGAQHDGFVAIKLHPQIIACSNPACPRIAESAAAFRVERIRPGLRRRGRPSTRGGSSPASASEKPSPRSGAAFSARLG